MSTHRGHCKLRPSARPVPPALHPSPPRPPPSREQLQQLHRRSLRARLQREEGRLAFIAKNAKGRQRHLDDLRRQRAESAEPDPEIERRIAMHLSRIAAELEDVLAWHDLQRGHAKALKTRRGRAEHLPEEPRHRERLTAKVRQALSKAEGEEGETHRLLVQWITREVALSTELMGPHLRRILAELPAERNNERRTRAPSAP